MPFTEHQKGLNKSPKTIDRNELLKEKTIDKETENKTLIVLTNNRFLPDISNALESTGICLILAKNFKGYSKKN